MRIKRVEVWSQEFQLKQGYEIAYGQFDKVGNVFVRIHTSLGPSGLGCAAPDPHVTGETFERVHRVLQEIAAPLLQGRDPLRVSLRMEQLSKLLKSYPSARAAIDMALHDLLGIVAKMPLYKLLGGYRHSIKTSVTIGVMNEAQTVAAARDLVKQGFRVLKIKGGLDANEDASRVRAVRKAVGNAVEIRFDANQGYTSAQAVSFVQGCRDAAVSILEQPTPAQQYDLLGVMTRRLMIPVMADESLITLKDAFLLAKRHLVNMVNVKLMKVGGIAEALSVSSVAKAASVPVMVGCMDEAAIAIAAGLHFALARPNVQYADLDGHLDLVDDPTAGAVVLKNGVLYPSDRDGLGG